MFSAHEHECVVNVAVNCRLSAKWYQPYTVKVKGFSVHSVLQNCQLMSALRVFCLFMFRTRVHWKLNSVFTPLAERVNIGQLLLSALAER